MRQFVLSGPSCALGVVLTLFLIGFLASFASTRYRPATAYLFVPGDIDLPDGRHRSAVVWTFDEKDAAGVSALSDAVRLFWTVGYDDYHKDFVEELDFRNGPITVFGARDFAMQVWLDPDRLQSLNLTAQDVTAALQGVAHGNG